MASVPEVGSDLTDARDLERPDTSSKIVIEPTGGLDFDPTFASFTRRAVGFLIDHLIVTAAALPGLYLARPGSSPGGKILGIVVMSIAVLIVFVVSGRAVAHSTKWIGNRVTGTSVVNAVNGANITRSYAMTRNFLRHVLSPLLLAGFIVALFDSQRRTFHDRFAGSVVIGRPREVWVVDSGPNDRKSSG